MPKFKDENFYLHHFSGRVLVHCPECSAQAQVQQQAKEDSYIRTLFCQSCGYYADDDKKHYHLNFRRNCPECGKQIVFKINDVTIKKQTMKVTCPHCGFTESYKPRYIEHVAVQGGIKQGKDPYFNADLWLQKDYRGDLFWAVNVAHLDYLEKYIEATSRQRNDAPRMSMIATLPKFIKSKKNRQDLLRIIEQLRHK